MENRLKWLKRFLIIAAYSVSMVIGFESLSKIENGWIHTLSASLSGKRPQVPTEQEAG